MQKHDLFPNDCDEGDGDVNFSGGGVPVVFVIVVGAVFRFSFFLFAFHTWFFSPARNLKLHWAYLADTFIHLINFQFQR